MGFIIRGQVSISFIVISLIALLSFGVVAVVNESFNMTNYSQENVSLFVNESIELNISEVIEVNLSDSVDNHSNISNNSIGIEEVGPLENKTEEKISFASTDLKEVLDSKELGKVHKDLWSVEEENVIIELKDKDSNKDVKKKLSKSKKSKDSKYVFAKVSNSELIELVKDNKVKKVWPDLETQSFLNSSTSLIEADYLWNSGLSGSNVKICVLDTGLDMNHEMFSNRTIEYEDFTSSSIDDGYGHGTHVAGIALGDGYYRGVAYNASIYIGKVLDDNGYGQLSWLINGIEWCEEQEVDVISLSLGALYSGSAESQLSSPEVLKVEEAVANGINVIIASGNCGQGCGGFTGVTTPGIAQNAITVGAVDSSLDHAYFSSGQVVDDYIKPDLVAPGVGVCSSVPNGYDCFSGTSMATPFVAGAVGLILEKNNSLSPYQVKSMLEESAVDLGSSGKDILYGSGFVDLSSVFDVSVNNTYVEEGYVFFANNLQVGHLGEIGIRYSVNESKDVTVNMRLYDFDDLIMENVTKFVVVEDNFTISFVPEVTGKYLVEFDIYEDSSFVESVSKYVYVSGYKTESMSSVMVRIR